MYGRPERVPTPEDEPLRPANVYAATKVAAEAVLRSRGERVVILRPANQLGPRQHARLAASEFARQIAEAEARGDTPLRVVTGNVKTRRDFTDVRDVVRAYRLLAEHGEPGVYNVCSGRAWRIGDLLELMLRGSRVPIRVEVDSARLRPIELPRLVGDNTRLRALGWTPRIPVETMVGDVLEHWRTKTPR